MLALLLSASMVFSTSVPATVALAESHSIQIQNHWQANNRTTVSDVRIDGVLAPKAGALLDDEARVTTSPNAAWDIPVLWVSDDLTLATEAEECKAYLPVLAFFVPQDYSLAGDAQTVELSESLTKLFGGNEIISVYNEATGITYILPAAAKNLFVAASDAQPANEYEATASDSGSPAELVDESGSEENPQDEDPEDEDLEWLIDLIINTIEPQAVNLLVNKFPAFSAAAQEGAIGKQIGMYILLSQRRQGWRIRARDGSAGGACVRLHACG